MPEFKPGDVVRLKSGGPRMTVYFVASSTVSCKYFSTVKGEMVNDTFGQNMLQTFVQGEEE